MPEVFQSFDPLRPVSREQLKSLNKEDLITLLLGEQSLRMQAQQLLEHTREENMLIGDKYVLVKNQLFGRSSERADIPPNPESKCRPRGNKKKKCQKLSERYENLPLLRQALELKDRPSCPCCATEMTDSSLDEVAEYLSVRPVKFTIIEQHRKKYRCPKCHGALVTTPAPPRIMAGSSYGDEMIVDVSLSKYCDLIPIERYAKIAERAGVKGLPPQSLIELTHYLADFLEPVYRSIEQNVLEAKVLNADETPHRMLERIENKNQSWFLWGFSNQKSQYFEIHDTRSGDVSSEFLKKSFCQRLVSDKYSGYEKSVRVTNQAREEKGLPPVKNCFCNAHARRKFKQAEVNYPIEAKEFIELYSKIYRLEKIGRNRSRTPARLLKVRARMKLLFEKMKSLGEKYLDTVSSKSTLATAIKYFTQSYEELTRFIDEAEVPIDNNAQERALRNPVIGRKTWYGTHSERGAKTNAVLFSLVESCKLSGVNPRNFFEYAVRQTHANQQVLIPHSYKSHYPEPATG